ncbi:MAG: AraC family transcriptional regulator [Pseudomonadota bacterium]
MHAPTVADVTRIYDGFNASAGPGSADSFSCIRRVGDADNSIRLEMSSAATRGYWELLRLNSDTLICVADGHYAREFRHSILPRRDIVTIRFVLSGLMEIHSADGTVRHVPEASASILQTAEDERFDLSILEGSHLCSVTVHTLPESLRHGFGVDTGKLPGALRDVLFGGAEPGTVFPVPLACPATNNVRELLRMPFAGTRRRLFTEAKVVEMTCRLFQEIEESHGAAAAGRRTHDDRIEKARQLLTADLTGAPSIEQLVRHAGLNRTTLSARFKDKYGVSLHEYHRRYRMNAALRMLRETPLSIAAIADSLGFSHATNFSAAFKRQFGAVPKDVRPPVLIGPANGGKPRG